MFHAQAVDKDGHHTVEALGDRALRVEHLDPAEGLGDAVPYSFELPADAKGPLAVQATLRYRSYDQALANLLLGAGAPKIPVIDMVAASGEIPLR